MLEQTVPNETPTPSTATPQDRHVSAGVRARSYSRYFSSITTWVCLCLIWAAIVAWSHRHEMDPDGFSYLQMASRAAQGEPSALLNAYWSPVYPALLAGLLALLRPSPEAAFGVAHFLNYLIFACALGAFVFFLRSWSKVVAIERAVLVPCGFVLFLKFAIDWIGVHNCTPDLAVATAVLLASGILAQLAASGSPKILLPLLGLVLAFGYYVKAAMFPLSCLLLALLFCLPPAAHLSRFSIWKAVAFFVLASTPLIVAESRIVGHLSFGESGNLNYAWYVNGAPTVQGERPPAPGFSLQHPPRRISQDPPTLEFTAPVKATYPLWYDPFYWSKGIQPSFDTRQQISNLGVTLAEYGRMLAQVLILIIAAPVLFLTGPGVVWLKRPQTAWMLLWPLSAVELYALVHTEPRFLGGFMIVFWTAILSVGLRGSRLNAHAALAIIAVGLLLPTSGRLVLAMRRAETDLVHPSATSEMLAAQALRADGLKDGDRIAIVGATFEPYYAWFANVNVVAQVPDANAVWHDSPDRTQRWLDVLRANGIKAVVALNRPAWANQIRWQDVTGNNNSNSTILRSAHYSIYLLPSP